jgi:hypothetical protein
VRWDVHFTENGLRSCIVEGIVLDTIVALEYCNGDKYRQCPFTSMVDAPIEEGEFGVDYINPF